MGKKQYTGGKCFSILKVPFKANLGPAYIGYVIPGDAVGDAECGLLVTSQ